MKKRSNFLVSGGGGVLSGVDAEFAALGAARGLLFLGNAVGCGSSSRLFMCSQGHKINVSIGSLRYVGQSDYACPECQDHRMRLGASALNIKILKWTSRVGYARVICPAGKHELDLLKTRISPKLGSALRPYICKECVEEADDELAKSRGLTRGRVSLKGSRYREYKCPSGLHLLAVKRESLRLGISGLWPCKECMDFRDAQIAKKRGLELVCKIGGAGPARARYRCPNGHEFDYKVSAMNLYCHSAWHCSECFEEKFQRTCADRSVSPLCCSYERDGDSSFFVKHHRCGHETRTTLPALDKPHLSGTPLACSVCTEQRYAEAARKVGLLFLGSSDRGGNYLRYQTNCCSKEIELQSQSVSRFVGPYLCNECRESEIQVEAAEHGAQLIGQPFRNTDGGCYRRFRLGCCGSIQEIRREHMKNGNFECATCGESTWLEPSYLYVLSIQPVGASPFIKCGYSKMLQVRQGKIKRSACETKTVVLCTKAFSTRADAHAAEQWILHHEALGDKKLAASEIRQYIDSGFTECFRNDAANMLLNLVEEAHLKFNMATKPRKIASGIHL